MPSEEPAWKPTSNKNPKISTDVSLSFVNTYIPDDDNDGTQTLSSFNGSTGATSSDISFGKLQPSLKPGISKNQEHGAHQQLSCNQQHSFGNQQQQLLSSSQQQGGSLHQVNIINAFLQTGKVYKVNHPVNKFYVNTEPYVDGESPLENNHRDIILKSLPEVNHGKAQTNIPEVQDTVDGRGPMTSNRQSKNGELTNGVQGRYAQSATNRGEVVSIQQSINWPRANGMQVSQSQSTSNRGDVASIQQQSVNGPLVNSLQCRPTIQSTTSQGIMASTMQSISKPLYNGVQSIPPVPSSNSQRPAAIHPLTSGLDHQQTINIGQAKTNTLQEKQSTNLNNVSQQAEQSFLSNMLDQLT